MVKLTASLIHWLFKVGKQDLIPLLGFGHLELFTKEMQEEYLAWCKTEEAKKYLKGGSEYRDPA